MRLVYRAYSPFRDLARRNFDETVEETLDETVDETPATDPGVAGAPP